VKFGINLYVYNFLIFNNTKMANVRTYEVDITPAPINLLYSNLLW
jgi:hypothetical protein